MSAEIYKLIHIFCLITVTACLGVGYLGAKPNKVVRILGMTASMILMVAGMGLLARNYTGMPWPNWVKAKLVIWGVIAIGGPIMAKRLTQFKGVAFSFFMGLFGVAIWLVVYKPF